VSLAVTEDTLVFGRKIAPGNAAIVGLTRASTLQSLSAEVANALGLASGTVLSDRLGGPSATVTGAGTVSVSIPAKGAVVLSP
jgi:hypothetical protein